MVWLQILILHVWFSFFHCAHHYLATWQASLYPHIREKLEGIILTSPALRVKPAHPIVGVMQLLCFPVCSQLKSIWHEWSSDQQQVGHSLNNSAYIIEEKNWLRPIPISDYWDLFLDSNGYISLNAKTQAYAAMTLLLKEHLRQGMYIVFRKIGKTDCVVLTSDPDFIINARIFWHGIYRNFQTNWGFNG